MPETPRGYPIPSGSAAPDVPYDLQRLAEAIDADVTASLDPDWIIPALSTGWSNQTGGGQVAYRLIEGGTMVEWTGSAIYNGTINAGGAVEMVACPAPLAAASDQFAVRLLVAVATVGIGNFNPRQDLKARFYAKDAYTANTPVHLHGLRYRVA